MRKRSGGPHLLDAIGSQEGEFHGSRKFKIPDAYRITGIVRVDMYAGVGLQYFKESPGSKAEKELVVKLMQMVELDDENPKSRQQLVGGGE